MSPSKTVLAMPQSTCSGIFFWAILDGLSWWLEVFTSWNIIFWMIGLLSTDFPRIFYSGASGYLYSVDCGYSTTSADTGVRLLFTLGGWVVTLGPCASLCALWDYAAVGMTPVAVVFSVVVVKISISWSKSSIWILLCVRCPQNAFSMSFSDFATAYYGVTVVWVSYLCFKNTMSQILSAFVSLVRILKSR